MTSQLQIWEFVIMVITLVVIPLMAFLIKGVVKWTKVESVLEVVKDELKKIEQRLDIIERK